MKRRALFILLLLVAGGIVNVAVAWRYSLRYPLPDKPMTSTGTEDRKFMQADLFGVSLKERNLQTGSWESSTWSVFQEARAGLPLKALQGARTIQDGTTVEQRWYWLVPLRPVWPGFAINTVFYAFILWPLFAVGGTPFALRRRRRIKRGLCPKCAYPVGTNDVCTECGAAVQKSS